MNAVPARNRICIKGAEMIINHPLLGPRDASEFYYIGDAAMIMRPDAKPDDHSTETMAAFDSYQHHRDNPHGFHRELWYHEQGDRSWLIVTRNTTTHEITKVELARDVKLKGGL